MLADEAARLQHTDQQTAMDCIALVDRINALIQPAYSAYGVMDCRQIGSLSNRLRELTAERLDLPCDGCPRLPTPDDRPALA